MEEMSGSKGSVEIIQKAIDKTLKVIRKIPGGRSAVTALILIGSLIAIRRDSIGQIVQMYYTINEKNKAKTEIVYNNPSRKRDKYNLNFYEVEGINPDNCELDDPQNN